MLRTFIFNDSKSHWIEEEHHLLSHDICVILDETQEIIYLWRGTKSSKEKFKKGYKQLKELVSKFPDLDLQLILVNENFPKEIQAKLESMVETESNEKARVLIFSRFTTIRIYLICLLIANILPFISLSNLSSSLLWSTSNGTYKVKNTTFQLWVNISKVLTIITLFVFLINLVIGIIESENQVIVLSIAGLTICVGLVLYLNFDIYLFLFQEGSTFSFYRISKQDVLYFLIVNIVSVLIFEIPNIYKLISFLKSYRKFIFF